MGIFRATNARLSASNRESRRAPCVPATLCRMNNNGFPPAGLVKREVCRMPRVVHAHTATPRRDIARERYRERR